MPPIRSFVALALLVTSATAQMSGAYTVNSTGSGTRNFKNVADSIAALYTQGVSGPVSVAIASGSYTEHLSLYPIRGASATNTITFRAATKHAARFNTTAGPFLQVWNTTAGTASHFVFEGLTLYATTSSSNPRQAIRFSRSSDIVMRHCVISQAYVTTYQTQSIKVHDNLFEKGSYLQIHAITADVHHNEFQMGSRSPMILSWYQMGPKRIRIYNNLIWGQCGQSDILSVGAGIDFIHNTLVQQDSGRTYAAQKLIQIRTSFLLGPRIENNVLINANGGYLMVADSSENLGKHYCNFEGNAYWAPKTTNKFRHGNSQDSTSVAAWRSATGQDSKSLEGDPKLENIVTGKLIPQPGSLATGKAIATPSYVTDDFAGKKRANPATIGAYEGQQQTRFEPFGKGCAGSFGHVPAIGYSGSLRMGSSNFAVTLSNALGGTGVRAFFAAGVTKTKIPFGGACNLLLSPAVVLPVPVGGSSGPGNGTASVRLVLPNDPKLRGAFVHLQWGVADPAAAGLGVAFSGGATLTL